jgi:hypothetical protein
MLQQFKNQKTIHQRFAFQIILEVGTAGHHPHPTPGQLLQFKSIKSFVWHCFLMQLLAVHHLFWQSGLSLHTPTGPPSMCVSIGKGALSACLLLSLPCATLRAAIRACSGRSV